MIDGIVELGDKTFSHLQKRGGTAKDSIHQASWSFFIDRYVNVGEIKDYRVRLCTANKNIESG